LLSCYRFDHAVDVLLYRVDLQLVPEHAV
jgi:hypothetical protein